MRALQHQIESFKQGMETFVATFTNKATIRLLFQGTDAKTDGTTIIVPDVALLDRINTTPEELREAQDYFVSMRGYIYHEAAHVLYTDFHATTAICRAKPYLSTLMNIVEDVRIEALLRQAYVGTRAPLDHLIKWAFDKSWQKLLEHNETKPLTPQEQITMLVLLTARGILARYPTQDVLDPAIIAHVANHAPQIHAACLAPPNKQGAVVDELFKALYGVPQSQPEAQPEEQRDGESESKGDDQTKSESQGKSDGDGESNGEGESGGADDGKGDAEGAGQGSGQTESNGDPSGRVGSLTAPSSAIQEIAQEALQEARQDAEKSEDQRIRSNSPAEAASHTKPYRVYTTAHDRVTTYRTGTPEELKEERQIVQKGYGPAARVLRNALKAKTLARTVSGLDAGQLDPGNLYKLAQSSTTTHAGLRNQARHVFAERIPGEALRATAVYIMIDASGSMSCRMETARRTALLLGDVLSQLQVPFAAATHTALGGYTEIDPALHNVYARFAGSLHIQVIKSYTEAWRHAALRISKVYPEDYNYDGEALRYAARQLQARREPRKILFMLSDGQPSCGSFESRSDHHTHLHNSVRDITASGIEVIGVAIQATEVKEFYPKTLEVENIEDLPKIVATQLRAMLAPESVKRS